MAKVLEVKTHADLEEVLTMWLNEEEREITSGNVSLIAGMVDKLIDASSPEMQKTLKGILGRLVSVEKQLDGLNDIVLLA